MYPFSRTQIIGVAVRVVSDAIELLIKASQPDKCGGYFTALSTFDGNLELIVRIGFSPEEKLRKLVEVSWENGRRLYGLPEHLTSYESRDPQARINNEAGEPWGKWGGAVRGAQLILSFFGLPELWNEAAMFVTAIVVRELDKDEVLAHISEERNPHLRPLLAVCDWVNQQC